MTGAVFSPCGTYRYHLHRRWADGPACLWIMLNPSTADAEANDPTVERCERRSREWGYPAVEVVNLFALRSTDPSALQRHNDPVGPRNDAEIIGAAENAGLIVCGWGIHGIYQRRSAVVRRLLAGKSLHCLRTTKSGEPSHPLYLPYSLRPMLWKEDQP